MIDRKFIGHQLQLALMLGVEHLEVAVAFVTAFRLDRGLMAVQRPVVQLASLFAVAAFEPHHVPAALAQPAVQVAQPSTLASEDDAGHRRAGAHWAELAMLPHRRMRMGRQCRSQLHEVQPQGRPQKHRLAAVHLAIATLQQVLGAGLVPAQPPEHGVHAARMLAVELLEGAGVAGAGGTHQGVVLLARRRGGDEAGGGLGHGG